MTLGLGESALTSTIGRVADEIEYRRVARHYAGSPGDRGQQRDLVAVRHGRVDATEVAHVVVVHVDVQESVQRAVVVEQLALDGRDVAVTWSRTSPMVDPRR